MEEEKIPLGKNFSEPKTGKKKTDASFQVKEELDEDQRPSENYKLAMRIIQEGLNHIKRDPTTPSKVIGAIKVLEDEANGNRSAMTNFEDKANENGGEQIKLEQKESTDHKEEYFEYF